MLNVSMDKLRALRAPVPPFAAQARFANLVWHTLDVKARYEAAEGAATELFDSLVQRAFLGELTKGRENADGLGA